MTKKNPIQTGRYANQTRNYFHSIVQQNALFKTNKSKCDLPAATRLEKVRKKRGIMKKSQREQNLQAPHLSDTLNLHSAAPLLPVNFLTGLKQRMQCYKIMKHKKKTFIKKFEQTFFRFNSRICRTQMQCRRSMGRPRKGRPAKYAGVDQLHTLLQSGGNTAVPEAVRRRKQR